VVVGTGLRNDNGSSRAGVIRRHCSIGREVLVRRTSEQTGPQSMAVYLRVPRFLGLLGSRQAQIAYFGERDRRFRERDRFERSVLSCVEWIVGSGCLKVVERLRG